MSYFRKIPKSSSLEYWRRACVQKDVFTEDSLFVDILVRNTEISVLETGLHLTEL